MTRYVAILADGPHGIRRLPIAQGLFGIGKINNTLTLEYIFKALRAIEGEIDESIHIVLPYGEGLDLVSPAYAPRDLFYRYSVPARGASYKKQGDYEIKLRLEMLILAKEYDVEVLPVKSDNGLIEWCRNTIKDDDRVIHINSTQVALNVALSVKLISVFKSSNFTSLAANGHRAGMTPSLFNPDVWIRKLENWLPHYGSVPPKPDYYHMVSIVLQHLEDNRLRFTYDNGRDTRFSLLLRRIPEPHLKTPEEIISELLMMGDRFTFNASSGRSFTIEFGDRLEYWVDRPPANFERVLTFFHRELDILNKQAQFKIRGAAVLEVGCGAGLMSLLFRRSGAKQVTGTDVEFLAGSPFQRRFLAEWPADDPVRDWFNLEGTRFNIDDPWLNFLECAGENLPFTNDSFNLVYCNQVLEHVRDPLHCLQEFLRVLQKNGILLLRYNPFFHLKGGHGACTTDVPWGHVRMTPDELEEFVTNTEFPERGQDAKESLATYFTPQRLTLAAFENFLEQLMPVEILYYHTPFNTHHSDLIDQSFLEECKANYPDVTIRDLLVNQVEIILRKK